MSASRPVRGLSLVEVLIALGVASVSMAAIVHSAGSVLAARRDADRAQAAAMLAEAGIEDVLARDAVDLAASDRSETIEDFAARFTRRTVVAPGPDPALWLVTVRVAAAPGATLAELRTLVRRPWSEP